MSKHRGLVRLSRFAISPWIILSLIVALQAGLVAAYYHLSFMYKLRFEPVVLNLLLVYTGIAIGIAILLTISRYRWIRREESVRQRLIDVIDAIPDPSAVRDGKGRYIMWNKAAETYHGIKAEHALGKTPFELFPAEVARGLLELDAECALSNKVVLRRVVLPPIYGKGQRVTNIRVAPVQSTANSPLRGVITILHDITVVEREAAAMRHMTTQLKMALDTSGFGSWIWDLEQNIATFSTQYKALLRYNGENFQQDFNFLSRLHPGDSEIVVAAAKQGLKENIPFDQVYRLRCFDEVYRYFHASGEAAFDDKGKRYFAGLLCPLDRSAD